jgi:hypothetical protein
LARQRCRPSPVAGTARESTTSAFGVVDGFLFVPRDDGTAVDAEPFPLWPPRLQPPTAARIERARTDGADRRPDARRRDAD